MWGPVITWCVLETIAESIDADNAERVALDLFDRLRLREPLAEAFNGLGFEGEGGWRAAARIKILLLAESIRREAEDYKALFGTREAGKAPTSPGWEKEGIATPGAAESADVEVADKAGALPNQLWQDADVRWLTGVNQAGDHTYFVCEPYEELVWWLQVPALLRLAGEAAPKRDAIERVDKSIQEGLTAAANAGYRIDKLTGAKARRPNGTGPRKQNGTEQGKALDDFIGAEEPDPLHESEEGRFTADPEFAGNSKEHEDLPIKHKK
jgi:hypothetical protein